MPLLGPFYDEAEALEECNSSSSGSDDSTDTDRVYCGCGDVPDTLTMTVTSDCEWANGSFAMTAHPYGGYTYTNPTANPGVTSVGTGRLCGWHVQIRCPNNAGFSHWLGFLSVESCSPFVATGTAVGGGKGSCCTPTSLSITVTG